MTHAGDIVLLEVILAELVGDHLRVSLLLVPEGTPDSPNRLPQRVYPLAYILDVLCYLVLVFVRKLLPHLHGLFRLGLLSLGHCVGTQKLGIDLAIILEHALFLF